MRDTRHRKVRQRTDRPQMSPHHHDVHVKRLLPPAQGFRYQACSSERFGDADITRHRVSMVYTKRVRSPVPTTRGTWHADTRAPARSPLLPEASTPLFHVKHHRTAREYRGLNLNERGGRGSQAGEQRLSGRTLDTPVRASRATRHPEHRSPAIQPPLRKDRHVSRETPLGPFTTSGCTACSTIQTRRTRGRQANGPPMLATWARRTSAESSSLRSSPPVRW